MSSSAIVVTGEAALEREYPYVYAEAQFPHLLVGKRVVVAGKSSSHELDNSPHFPQMAKFQFNGRYQ